MYKNKLAVALKSSGKVLREFGETVYVPFGSEYTILIKNLNSVRALVNVTVDGTDAGDGTQFVIDANSSLELERFINNGNLKEGNRFKFIERTGDIENHRGIGIEDGIVRVEFQFEKVLVADLTDILKNVKNDANWFYQPNQIWYGDGPKFNMLNKGPDLIGTCDVSFCSTTSAPTPSDDVFEITPQSEQGITVPGSVSDQTFTSVSSFPVENEKHVVVLHMLGETDENKKVRKPVTVKSKSKCVACGRTNKATAKFCSNCGTSLTIV